MTPVRTDVLSVEDLYDQVLRGLPDFGYISGYWSAGPVSYGRADGSILEPAAAPSEFEVWRDGSGFNGYAPIAATNADLQYRALGFHDALDQTGLGNSGQGRFVPVGQFDPALLRGFDPLSAVPLEAYSPPLATAADSATERVLGGEPYRSSLTPAGI